MKKLLLALAVFCLFASAAQAIDIKLGHVTAQVAPAHMISEMFKKKVEEKTNGQVTVTIFDNGTLGNEKNLQEGVRSGTVDMAVAASFHHVLPWAGILECPLLFRNMEHFIDVFSSPIGGQLAKMFEDQIRVKVLFIAPHGGFRYISTKSTPIKKPEDMVGLKIRNPNVPAYNILANASGAVPVPLDFSELYLALDRGVVQAQHNPVLNFVGGKFYEVQQYFVMVPWGITPHVVCMSNRMWNRLTPEQQQAVMEAGAETAKEYPALAKVEEEKGLAVFADRMTIIRPEEIDLEAFQKMFREKGIPELEKEYDAEVMKLFMSIVDFQ